ncbi:MAG: hypothetical protein EXX96DRAFT_458092, partial [Benjaminiella poitrasii]
SRLYKRRSLSQVPIHDLLRCANRNYRQAMTGDLRYEERLWNQDTAICLSMLSIVRHL